METLVEMALTSPLVGFLLRIAQQRQTYSGGTTLALRKMKRKLLQVAERSLLSHLIEDN